MLRKPVATTERDVKANPPQPSAFTYISQSHPAIPQPSHKHLLEKSPFSAEGKRPERVSARSLFCSKVAHSPGTVVMETATATAYRRVTRIFDMLPYFIRQSTLQEGQSSNKLSNINSILPTFLKLFSCFCLNAWRSSSCADRKSPAEGFSSYRSLPGSYRTSKSELQCDVQFPDSATTALSTAHLAHLQKKEASHNGTYHIQHPVLRKACCLGEAKHCLLGFQEALVQRAVQRKIILQGLLDGLTMQHRFAANMSKHCTKLRNYSKPLHPNNHEKSSYVVKVHHRPPSRHSFYPPGTLDMSWGFHRGRVSACSCAVSPGIARWTPCHNRLWPSTSTAPTNVGNRRSTNSSTHGWPSRISRSRFSFEVGSQEGHGSEHSNLANPGKSWSQTKEKK